MSIQPFSKQKIDIVEDCADEINTLPFPCTACGQCCRNVHFSPLTEYLSRGDGICQYLDESTNLCNIYEERPLVCKVEEYYQNYLVHKVSWKAFVELNIEHCINLQTNAQFY